MPEPLEIDGVLAFACGANAALERVLSACPSNNEITISAALTRSVPEACQR
jgi:hypothetical protein